MDIVSDILHTVGFSAVTDCCSELQGEWGIEFQPTTQMRFHIVLRGQACLRLGTHTQSLQKGDIVLLSQPQAHSLAAQSDTDALPAEIIIPSLQNQQSPFAGDLNCVLLTGTFDSQLGQHHPLFNQLPPLIYLSANQCSEHSYIKTYISQIGRAAFQKPIGYRTIMQQLSPVLFITILQNYTEQLPNAIPYFLKSADYSPVMSALQALHQSPDLNWTVQSMADRVALSRPTFSQHFQNKVGEQPAHYLNMWRMLKAAWALQHTQDSLQQIAIQVGYLSDGAFSKRFKTVLGCTPTEWRKQHS